MGPSKTEDESRRVRKYENTKGGGSARWRPAVAGKAGPCSGARDPPNGERVRLGGSRTAEESVGQDGVRDNALSGLLRSYSRTSFGYLAHCHVFAGRSFGETMIHYQLPRFDLSIAGEVTTPPDVPDCNLLSAANIGLQTCVSKNNRLYL